MAHFPSSVIRVVLRSCLSTSGGPPRRRTWHRFLGDCLAPVHSGLIGTTATSETAPCGAQTPADRRQTYFSGSGCARGLGITRALRPSNIASSSSFGARQSFNDFHRLNTLPEGEDYRAFIAQKRKPHPARESSSQVEN